MGILASNNKTLLDVAKETDANGKLPVVIELLSEENEILDDIPWIECNSGDAHKTSIRTGFRRRSGAVRAAIIPRCLAWT